MARVAARSMVKTDGLYGLLWDREFERMQAWAAVGVSDYPMVRLEAFRVGRPVEFPGWDMPDWARPRRRRGSGLRVVVQADDETTVRDEDTEEWIEDQGVGDDERGHSFWATGPRDWHRRAASPKAPY